MKPIPDRYKQMLAQLRELRRELKQLRENPQPRPDMLDAFRSVFRDRVKDAPEPQASEN